MCDEGMARLTTLVGRTRPLLILRIELWRVLLLIKRFGLLWVLSPKSGCIYFTYMFF